MTFSDNQDMDPQDAAAQYHFAVGQAMMAYFHARSDFTHLERMLVQAWKLEDQAEIERRFGAFLDRRGNAKMKATHNFNRELFRDSSDGEQKAAAQTLVAFFRDASAAAGSRQLAHMLAPSTEEEIALHKEEAAKKGMTAEQKTKRDILRRMVEAQQALEGVVTALRIVVNDEILAAIPSLKPFMMTYEDEASAIASCIAAWGAAQDFGGRATVNSLVKSVTAGIKSGEMTEDRRYPCPFIFLHGLTPAAWREIRGVSSRGRKGAPGQAPA